MIRECKLVLLVGVLVVPLLFYSISVTVVDNDDDDDDDDDDDVEYGNDDYNGNDDHDDGDDDDGDYNSRFGIIYS